VARGTTLASTHSPREGEDVRKIVGILLLGLGGTGCAERTLLAPAPGAPAAPGSPSAALATANGVQVIVEAGEPTGPRDIETAVTPLKVTIVNNGPEPVAIRYDHIYLEGPGGKRWAALPPYEAQKEAAQAITPPPPPPAPLWVYDRFLVAPHLRWYYPYLTAFADPFLYDDVYYDQYRRYWRRRRIAMRDVRAQAIPEGVLEPGGRVSGFLFFEHVPSNAGPVSLHADLLDARTGRQLATVVTPLTVLKAG
jgi:hypothetical protein